MYCTSQRTDQTPAHMMRSNAAEKINDFHSNYTTIKSGEKERNKCNQLLCSMINKKKKEGKCRKKCNMIASAACTACTSGTYEYANI